MKLHILRHAKTEPYSDSDLDIDRDLLPKGIQQSKLMADFLAQINPVEIHCSSSKRTRRTFDLVFSSGNYTSIHFSEELYLADLNSLLDYLSKLETQNDILLLAHNNGLSDLVNFLCDSEIDMKTCEYIELDIPISKWKDILSAKAIQIQSYHPHVVQ
ncbi:MAG: histidine phosphatase family protein [Flavobacteriia bacterium]|nr:histidine phosphatase family protein [Flavobacteriia bacterium]